MTSHASATQTQVPRTEGVAVVGEAIRRVAPETAEFLIEISATAASAAQALRDTHLKTSQIGQAISTLGVSQGDLQTISLNVYNTYAPVLPGFGGLPQIGQGGFAPYAAGAVAQPEVQFGSYHAKNTLRVNVREAGRLGEIVDAATRAGATVVGGLTFKASDEPGARRAALEAAGRDARGKAETLAAAAGKQVGEPVSISEDVVATNGAYAALRSAMPFAFGPGTPAATGELEYYARVSATFRLQ